MFARNASRDGLRGDGEESNGGDQGTVGLLIDKRAPLWEESLHNGILESLTAE